MHPLRVRDANLKGKKKKKEKKRKNYFENRVKLFKPSYKCHKSFTRLTLLATEPRWLSWLERQQSETLIE